MGTDVQDQETQEALRAFCEAAPYLQAHDPYMTRIPPQCDFTPIGGTTEVIDATPAAIGAAASYHTSEIRFEPLESGVLFGGDMIELPEDFGRPAETKGPQVAGPSHFIKQPPKNILS